MQFGIGTGGLSFKFNEDYWKIFSETINNQDYIHSALNYEHVDQYFLRAFSENLNKPKLIFKIEINKNPIKKLFNIPKQINVILERYKLDFIDTVQICNNPHADKLNLFLIKSIFKKYKKKKLINNFVLESFEPFSKNLDKIINDNFFNGYIFTLNCFQKGASTNFFLNILNSNKKIISISPLASSKSDFFFQKFPSDFKISLNEIMLKNKLDSINALQIAFLKSIDRVDIALFGTKNYERYKIIKFLIKSTNSLSQDDMKKIIYLQEKFHSPVLF